MRARRRLLGVGVLAAGVVVLAGGSAVAVVRWNRDVDARTARDAGRVAAQRDRYEQLIRDAAGGPARFSVSVVELPLAELRTFTRRVGGASRYQLVTTAVTRRMLTGKPALAPDLGTMPHPPLFDPIADAFRARRLRQVRTDLVALLVTWRAPPGVRGFRIRTDRFTPRDFVPIVDPTDVYGGYDGLFAHGRTPSRPEVVHWSSAPGAAAAIVPLFLVHDLRFAPGDADEASGETRVSVLTHAAYAPRALTVELRGGGTRRLPLKAALAQPLVLNAGPG